MRKIILCLAISFDGFIEGPNGELDWLVFDDEAGSALTDFLTEIDTVLYGRVSYEMWGNPVLTEESSEFEKNFYGSLAGMDRYVFSKTKTDFDGDPTVVSGDIPQLIQKLKQQPGKNIWLYGGASLITTFMNLDLVDEYRIAIMPVIIGEGKPLFKAIRESHKLRLIDVKPSTSGVLEIQYEAIK